MSNQDITTDLIPVHTGAGGVQTVNARDLHAFLEVQTRYNDWIKNRIEQYDFTEDQDFTTVTENLVSGGTQKVHHLTLDMAKELAMVEKTDKGKQARQYFIACEKQLRTLSAPAAPTAIPATKEFRQLYGIARLIGLDRNVAAISANQATLKITGTNVLNLLGSTHLEAEQQVRFFTPTELGERAGTSARGMNKLLAEAGLQVKEGKDWIATDAADGLYRLLDTGKKHGNGTPVTQMNWAAAALDHITVAA